VRGDRDMIDDFMRAAIEEAEAGKRDIGADGG
jgi:hypothetical protein